MRGWRSSMLVLTVLSVSLTAPSARAREDDHSRQIASASFGAGLNTGFGAANQMVLPANISQGLQSMLATPDGIGGSGGTAPSPVIVNVSAIDSQDVKRFFQSNGSLLVAALNKAMRNGSALRTA